MLLKMQTLRPPNKVQPLDKLAAFYHSNKPSGAKKETIQGQLTAGWQWSYQVCNFFPSPFSRVVQRDQVEGKGLKEEGSETIGRNNRWHRGDHSENSFTLVMSVNLCIGLCRALL